MTVGGGWVGLQGLGYGYDNLLRADMASCMSAVDQATIENGCLQVLKGSHRMGRLEHGLAGDQTGADLERVAVVLKHFETVHCEMEPGTVPCFHSNLLPRSEPSVGDHSRWALICCYSAASNPTFRPDAQAGCYEKLECWSAEEVGEAVRRHQAELAVR